MAIVVINELPDVVTDEMYDAVSAKIGQEPPDGGIVHTGGRDDSGTMRVVEVWESREALERFENERLRPAIAEVMRANGMDPEQAPRPEQTVYEAREVMSREAMVGAPTSA
ncbi:MAG: hypothetical protein QOF37_1160 [Thermoleophilaceae bacterium]|jgi:hypothetical protein|nr:hypothetical protein [Thermoleophilaceae bacterium]